MEGGGRSGRKGRWQEKGWVGGGVTWGENGGGGKGKEGAREGGGGRRD